MAHVLIIRGDNNSTDGSEKKLFVNFYIPIIGGQIAV